MLKSVLFAYHQKQEMVNNRAVESVICENSLIYSSHSHLDCSISVLSFHSILG